MCKYLRSCNFILVEASTVCTDNGRKGVLEVVDHVVDSESVSAHPLIFKIWEEQKLS